jgi:hypothetical protein
MRPKIWLGAILLSLMPLLAAAQDQHESLVQELYVKSGLEKQIQDVPRSIQAGLDQPLLEAEQFPEPSPRVISLMKSLAPEAFAPEKLKAVVLPEIKARLTTPDLQAVLKWLDSPLGIKCTRLEEEASTPEAYAEISKYAAQLKKSPPTPERLKIIQKLDVALKATQASVEMALNLQVALSLAVNATLPKEQQQSPADIMSEIKQHQPEIEAALRLESLVSLIYTYRSLTEAEIKQYIKFATSPAGSKYQEVADAAVKKALIAGGIRWGEAIGEAMKQLEGQTEA